MPLRRLSPAFGLLISVAIGCRSDIQLPSIAERGCLSDRSDQCVLERLGVDGYVRLHAFVLDLHDTGQLDVARLVQLPREMFAETAPPLVLGGLLVAMEDAAQHITDSYRRSTPPPRSSSESESYARELIEAFVKARIDLSGRPVPTFEDEDIQMEVI